MPEIASRTYEAAKCPRAYTIFNQIFCSMIFDPLYGYCLYFLQRSFFFDDEQHSVHSPCELQPRLSSPTTLCSNSFPHLFNLTP